MKRAAVFLAPLLVAQGCITLTQKPTDPELVTLEAKLGQPILPAAQTNEVQAVLKIRATAPEDGVRVPLHIAVVIDASGSMQGEAIARAREAAIDLLKRLDPKDRFTVVAFNTKAELLAKGEPIEDIDVDALEARLANLKAVGTTNLTEGLATAVSLFEKPQDPREVRRLVLLSDGRPNTPELLRNPIARLTALQVPVTALGLGLDYDELLLARIAQASGGRFTFVEEPKMIAEVFEREVMRLDRVVGKMAQLVITPGPGVEILRVEGETPANRGGTYVKSLGDLSAQETREVVVSMKIDARNKDVTLEMIDAVLTFDDAIAHAGNLERRAYLAATTTLDSAKAAASRDVNVLGAAARARAGSAALDAISMARHGQREQAEALLRAAIVRAKGDAEHFEDPRLAEAIQNLERLLEDLPAAAAQAHLEEKAVSAKNRRAHSSAWSYTH